MMKELVRGCVTRQTGEQLHLSRQEKQGRRDNSSKRIERLLVRSPVTFTAGAASVAGHDCVCVFGCVYVFVHVYECKSLLLFADVLQHHPVETLLVLRK